MKTKLLIEQHFHGCFGIDFNKASVDDVLYLSKEILKYGIGGIFPTLVTDSVENTKRAISVIKQASEKQTDDMAKILGIHLEGIFINPEKKGIHNTEHFMSPTIENFKKIEDDFIKIVTLAPELAYSPIQLRSQSQTGKFQYLSAGLIQYLRNKRIKVQAGHCTGGDLTGCDGVTHLFNAMSGISHRGKSTTLSALTDDNIYTEIIADGVHVSDDALKLAFKSKPLNKIILISDCLPCTKSKLSEFVFADEKIYFDGTKATSKEGTLAGSTALLPDIIKRLASIDLFNTQYIYNPYKYHKIDLDGTIEWDEDWNIVKVSKSNITGISGNSVKSVLAKINLKSCLVNENIIGKGNEAIIYRIPNTDYVIRIEYEDIKNYDSIEQLKDLDFANIDFNDVNYAVTYEDNINQIVAKIGDKILIKKYITGKPMSKMNSNMADCLLNLPKESIQDYFMQIEKAKNANMFPDTNNANCLFDTEKEKLTIIDFHYGGSSTNPLDMFMYHCADSENLSTIQCSKILQKGLTALLDLVKQKQINTDFSDESFLSHCKSDWNIDENFVSFLENFNCENIDNFIQELETYSI